MPRFDVNLNLKSKFYNDRRLLLITLENILDIDPKQFDLIEGLLAAGKELDDDEAKLLKAFQTLDECVDKASDMSEIMKEYGGMIK